MKADDIQNYIQERNELTAAIVKGIMKAVAEKIRDLPDEAMHEFGEVVFNSGSDVAEAIMEIMAAEIAEDFGEY